MVGKYRRVISLFKAGFDDNEQILCLMFIDRETRQNSSIWYTINVRTESFETLIETKRIWALQEFSNTFYFRYHKQI